MVAMKGRARLLGVVLLLVVAGCATKRDVRTLQQRIDALEQQQRSVAREMQQQTQLVLDTLRSGFAIQRDLRGETSHRFQQLEENLSRLEEMINQTQLVVAQLLERLERPSMGGPSQNMGGTPSVGAAEDLYQQGMEFLQQQSYATARTVFEEIVRSFPNDPRAADAQFALAETYAGEGNAERALAEFEKVERQWPRAEKAPQALLRAGIVARDANQRDRAREYFQQVRQRFPASPEAQEAERLLRSLR